MINRAIVVRAAFVGGFALVLSGCEIGPKKIEQTGFRGTGGDQITAKARLTAQTMPPPPFALPDDSGPRASETYANVKVLGNISTERFNYLMAAMNNWVAPVNGDPDKVGCNYCHNPNNMASDEKYTKVVARRMLQMTQNINSTYASHVKGTGVTCYTCHRGNAVPQYKWAAVDAPGGGPNRLMGNKHGQNTPTATVAYASLPYGGLDAYLQGSEPIRVQGVQPLRTAAGGASIAATEKSYGLMMHMSSALNVNCTFCHNTNSFSSWNNSRGQRAQAWYGIRMVRDANATYINSLTSVFPAFRKGPHGDPYKINCTTCHQGLNKPLGGVSVLKDYPFLAGAAALPVVGKAPAPDPNATASSCNADFAKALAGHTVEFDTGAATVRPVSIPLLDLLTDVAGRCGNFAMLVSGHTDAVGNAASNLALSQSRAAAVEKYFVDKGVPAAQVSAQGFGSTKPLDSSGTTAGNQRNRRIEISVAATKGG